MKHFQHPIMAIATILAIVSCCQSPSYYGERTEALNSSCWEHSEWISAADAPVINNSF